MIKERVKYEDDETVYIDGKKWFYSEHYDYLESPKRDEEVAPAICCPHCERVEFSISYGTYRCIANCSCGHKMVIYEG